ncbi:Multidrug resistance-associated protein 9 [Oryzias melastigma]|uniref:Multidrug resistance-associated protein 9 n=1 Tax=Oryzias melastigma TaxID=30732 RepID=A0A834F118_ORYME|nr:Multidrug resistance-associated protein 9 [Oryzias melastigma]
MHQRTGRPADSLVRSAEGLQRSVSACAGAPHLVPPRATPPPPPHPSLLRRPSFTSTLLLIATLPVSSVPVRLCVNAHVQVYRRHAASRLAQLEESLEGTKAAHRREILHLQRLLSGRQEAEEKLLQSKREVEEELEMLWQAATRENRVMRETLVESETTRDLQGWTLCDGASPGCPSPAPDEGPPSSQHPAKHGNGVKAVRSSTAQARCHLQYRGASSRGVGVRVRSAVAVLHTEGKMKTEYALEKNSSRRASFTDDGFRWRTGSEVSYPEQTPDADNGRPRHRLFGKYHQSIQTLKPLRWSSSQSNPVDNAGFLSFVTFAWMTPMMWAMFRNRLDFSSLCLSQFDVADSSGERLWRLWEQQVEQKGLQKASLIRAVLRFQRTRLILSVIIGILVMTAAFIGPAVLVNEILKYIENPGGSSVAFGVGLAVALFTSEFFKAFFISLLWAVNLRTAVRLKGAFSTMAFQKAISLRVHSDVSMGEMINVLTNDGHRLFEAVLFGSFTLSTPVLFVACIVYACYILGYTALTGVCIYLIFVPVQFMLAKLINKFRWRAILITDNRVRTMNEILNSIKLIKMYAWEESFEEKIAELRKTEKKQIRLFSYVQNTNTSVTSIVPTMATVATFLVHTLMGLELNASDAFTTIAIFNSMRFCLALLPLSVKSLAEAAVSISRLKVRPHVLLAASVTPTDPSSHSRRSS